MIYRMSTFSLTGMPNVFISFCLFKQSALSYGLKTIFLDGFLQFDDILEIYPKLYLKGRKLSGDLKFIQILI